MMKYQPAHVLVGTEVVEKVFTIKSFLENSRKNLDCHIRLPDDERFSKEHIEAEDREFQELLDELFDKN